MVLGEHSASSEDHHPSVQGDLEGETAAGLDNVSQDVLFFRVHLFGGRRERGGRGQGRRKGGKEDVDTSRRNRQEGKSRGERSEGGHRVELKSSRRM